jgi:hypothetical protein
VTQNSGDSPRIPFSKFGERKSKKTIFLVKGIQEFRYVTGGISPNPELALFGWNRWVWVVGSSS